MNTTPDDDDGPSEVDFAGGVRGRFHRPNAALIPPVHLDADVLAALQAQAVREGVSLDALVNRLLKEDLAALGAR
jgi:hypothetical protein